MIFNGLNFGYVKSDFSPVQQMAVARDGSLLHGRFNLTDEKHHSKPLRAVNDAFSMTTLVQFEPLVESSTIEYSRKLSRRCAGQEAGICDFGQWLQFYAFHVIGELAFSKRLGFVDHCVDVDNIIGNIESLLGYSAVISQMPFFDKLLEKNPLGRWLSRIGLINVTSLVTIFARNRMEARLKDDSEQAQNTKRGQSTRRDLLFRFMEANEKDLVFINAGRVLSLDQDQRSTRPSWIRALTIELVESGL
ncbi:hypothetical protein PV11_02873 [Exophiala sideris]|uniref:Uncharacterized protein n=1 Tax=Exophiala sideris TaxID=1016849 RepID=A0A0D1ZKH9_9EURO|nr:hypothetical protein PV11_02873 [Exophiala sideris]